MATRRKQSRHPTRPRNRRPLAKGVLAGDAGSVLVHVTLLLTVLIGFAGLGTEAGLWMATKRSMQAAADQAALSAALTLSIDQNATSYIRQGRYIAGRNGFQNGVKNITVEVLNPPTSGNHVGNADYVEVIISNTEKPLLSALWLGSVKLTAHAVALKGATSGPACVLALDKSSYAQSFYATGSTIVNLNKCGIFANSNNPAAVSITGSAVVTTAGVTSSGGISLLKPNDQHLGTQTTDAIPLADPYAAQVNANVIPSCKGSKPFDTSKPNPGTYLDFKIPNKTSVTLAKGTYFICGEFSVGGSVDATAGVTFVFLAKGTFDIQGTATLKLTAPTSGAWKGLAMYQKSGDTDIKINGNTNTSITGALYFPTAKVTYSGNTTTPTSCTQLVVTCP